MSFSQHQRQAATAIRGQRFTDAVDALEAALAERPDDFDSRWLLVRCLEQLREVERARAELARLLGQVIPDEAVVTRLAEHMRQAGYPLDVAADAFAACLQQAPGSGRLAYNLAWYRAASGDAPRAVAAYEQALELGVQGAEEVHLNLANLYMDRLDNASRARRHLQAALDIRPDYVVAHYNLGNLEEREGNREAAQRCFRQCLALEPGNEQALARLADAHVFKSGADPLLTRLDAAVPGSRLPDLAYSLARARDQVGDYPAAATALVRANELDRATLPVYDPAAESARFDRIIERCSSEWLTDFAGTSHPAVMICGSFRSGSTLLERMLGAHPGLTAGGESEFFPRLASRELGGWPDGIGRVTPALAADWRARHAREQAMLAAPGTRLIDKRPDNLLYMGLIRAVLPSARFIVTERDWRDVAVSMLATRLGPGQPYATRVADIRHYLGLQHRLLDHWASIMGDAIVRVRYEDLVQAPRETLERVLAGLGLPWNDAGLAFDRQAGMVATASVWQVREGLHTRSVGRWENYQALFD